MMINGLDWLYEGMDESQLGQFRMPYSGRPTTVYPGMPMNFVPRSAQANRFQAPLRPGVRPDKRVRISTTKGATLAEGLVSQAAIDRVFEWARTDRGGDYNNYGSVVFEVIDSGGSRFSPGGMPFGVLLVHATPQNISEVLRILGLRRRPSL